VLSWAGRHLYTHPEQGEQIVRYYGYYRNAARGKQKKKDSDDDVVPCVLESQEDVKASRKSWARLIQKIGICPCEGWES